MHSRDGWSEFHFRNWWETKSHPRRQLCLLRGSQEGRGLRMEMPVSDQPLEKLGWERTDSGDSRSEGGLREDGMS